MTDNQRNLYRYLQGKLNGSTCGVVLPRYKIEAIQRALDESELDTGMLFKSDNDIKIEKNVGYYVRLLGEQLRIYPYMCSMTRNRQ